MRDPMRMAVQWSEQSKSRFYVLQRIWFRLGAAVLLLLVFGAFLLIWEVGSWAYRSADTQWHRYQNASLRQDLALLLKKQSHVEASLDQLHVAESKIRAVYGMGAEDKNVLRFGVGGRRNSVELFAQYNFPLMEQLSRAQSTLRHLHSRIDYTSISLLKVQEFVKYKQKLWEHTPSTLPAKGDRTSAFGWRTHPVTGRKAFHEGLDIANSRWTPVYATAAGIVTVSGRHGNFGKLVVIDHGNGYQTKFGHLNKLVVGKGELVKRYALIGYMGDTGRTTGPHLHYEVHRDGNPVNPSDFILPAGLIVD